MSVRLHGAVLAGGILLLASTAFLAQAVATGVRRGVELGSPTLAPIIVTALWTAVSLAYLLGRLRESGRRPDAGVARWRVPFLLLAALIGYALVLKYTVAGYVLASTAFFVISARLLSTRPLREVIVRDLCVAIGLSLAIYLAFTRLLGISLPAGVLPL